MKVYVRIPTLSTYSQLATAAISTPFRTQLKSFCKYSQLLVIQLNHVDAKYLMIKTRTGSLTLQLLFLFSTFTEFAMVIYKKWVYIRIVHIQSLLRINGSILADVFLTSSFCVVPESSGSSKANQSRVSQHAYTSQRSRCTSVKSHYVVALPQAQYSTWHRSLDPSHNVRRCTDNDNSNAALGQKWPQKHSQSI